MSNTADHWHLNVIAHTDRLVRVAMEQLNDANEARWVVHRVMLSAMTDMLGPEPQTRLDKALNAALRLRPANAA